jgi:hypothetical protein
VSKPVPRKPKGLGSMFEADNGLRVPRDEGKITSKTGLFFESKFAII